MILTRELETLLFILIASAIGLFAAFTLRQPKHFNSVSFVAALPSFISGVAPAPQSTVSPIPNVTTTVWTSSDGTEKITLKTVKNPNLSTTYTATNTDSTGKNIVLFVEIVPGVSTMIIPFNAFSSDNSYVFLKETVNTITHYLVFSSTGTPFADGKYSEDVKEAFTAYTSEYSLADVIGWASPTLLIVNTKNTNGSDGPSLWFDVTTKAFIPLATHFD